MRDLHGDVGLEQRERLRGRRSGERERRDGRRREEREALAPRLGAGRVSRRVGRGRRLEADGRRPARSRARVLDLEELAPAEAEHARDQHGREDLDRVVVGQNGVVVDLTRDRDLVLGVLELGLQVEEALVRLQVRVGLGDGEQPADRLAEQALGRADLGGGCAPRPPRRAPA